MTRDKKLWTPQEDATLRRLCAEKFTYGDISLKMDRPLNGVKARVKHLKISHPLYRVKGFTKVVMAKNHHKAHPDAFKAFIEAGHCKWPLFDESKLFCNAVCDDKYCATHLRLSRGRE